MNKPISTPANNTKPAPVESFPRRRIGTREILVTVQDVQFVWLTRNWSRLLIICYRCMFGDQHRHIILQMKIIAFSSCSLTRPLFNVPFGCFHSLIRIVESWFFPHLWETNRSHSLAVRMKLNDFSFKLLLSTVIALLGVCHAVHLRKTSYIPVHVSIPLQIFIYLDFKTTE